MGKRKEGSTAIAFSFLKNNSSIIAYCLPFVLMGTMYLFFLLLTRAFGKKPGYFFGFCFYWFFWCFTVPIIILGWNQVKELFKISKENILWHKQTNLICLVLPLVLVYSYSFTMWKTNLLIIVTSLLLAVVNATMEELLWRGLYLKLIPDYKVYVQYSSFGFAIWHFAPQVVFPNHAPGGQFSFVIVAYILGLLYSIVTKNLKSILPTSISHILFDLSGLGGRLYFS